METFITKCNKYKVEKNYQLTLGNTFSLLFTVADREKYILMCFYSKSENNIIASEQNESSQVLVCSGPSLVVAKMLSGLLSIGIYV